MASRGKEEKRDYRLEVADRLIQQIEQGTARWQRPWKAGEILAPVNAVTGKPYRGVNYENLMAFSPDPSDPRWCTYKQAQEQGWQVRQGASGLPLEVWKEYEHKRTVEEIQRLEKQGVTNPEPTERRLGVRYYTVFHASQMDGIPPLERQEPNQKLEGKPDTRLPKLAESLGVKLRYGGGRAFYRPSEDLVQMPPVESFEQAVGHDTTLLHELSHATGHEKRLNRDLRNSFGSEKYAIEELRAEMSAAMTAASLGLGFDPAAQDREEGRETLAGSNSGNSAAYLASWLKALPEKDRKQSIMQAIKDAQSISDYLIERTPELLVEQEKELLGVSRGDYVRYRNEIGQEVEGVVLDAAQPGEATRVRHIYRWPNGTPGMDGVDHVAPTLLPDDLVEHIPGAVTPGPDLDAIDPRTDAYQRTMGMDDSRDRAGRAVLMAVETARGQPEQAAALRAAAAQERALDPDLISFLEIRNRVRQGEHPDFAGLSDPVANAETFVERQGRIDPQRSARWARSLQESPVAYGEAVGLSPATVGLVASQLNQGARRMERPQVGDLVRFEPHKPGVTNSPFSGRVFAALDTNTGDIRYHLRADFGPDQGIEARVYGRDGQFREIALDQAVGFDRNAPEHLTDDRANQKEQAIASYMKHYDELPDAVNDFIDSSQYGFDRLRNGDIAGFHDFQRQMTVERNEMHGIIADGPNKGAHGPTLALYEAGMSQEEVQHLIDSTEASQIDARQGDREKKLATSFQEQFIKNLKEYGKDILQDADKLPDIKLAQAVYWKHGIAVENDHPMLNSTVQAIHDKDLKGLLSRIGHNSQNPATQEVFERMTNIKLGKTQSMRVKQLETWAGADRVAALDQERAEKARQKAEEAPRKALRQAFDALSYSKIQISTEAGSKVVDGQQYIEWKAAHGYTHVGDHKKGAVVERFLKNPETNETSRIKDRRFGEFCKAVQGLEPGGDLMKAMEIAKIPLDLPQKEPEKIQATQVSNPVPKAPDPEKITAYEAKRQARQDRYRALAEKMRLRAKARLDQAHKMAGAIPFGQPILVGHHSENRDRRYRERIHKTFGQGFGLMDRAGYYERRSERMSNGISSDDPAAVQKLKEKLEHLKMSQEKMKAANAVIRKFRDPDERKSGMERIGFTAEQADKILTPDVMGTIGFASYSLSNNNANIRRIEERIKGLEKAQTLEDRTTEYRWGAVRENKENNRIQFLFEGKPDGATRKLMKESGFRWAPSEEAWQRQWTGNAVHAAREAIKKLDARMPPEQAEQVLERAPAPAESRIASMPPVPPDLLDSTGAADRLVKSLAVLEQHSITLTRADGTGKTVNARRYLDEGIARGFTEADTAARPLAWVNPDTSTRLNVRDEALAATLRAAHTVDPHIGRAIQSVARQKNDLEWEM
ncbi:DUF3560 domain-containing protein [Acidithiobacillus ferrooxidans]|uniref:DUF3560 domain-containing protein n=3 Tax=Acidithiobacillus TaxID=119977 RepID=UPI000A63C3EF